MQFLHLESSNPFLRTNSAFFLLVAIVLDGGAITACWVLKPMLPCLMDVSRGYPYYPADDMRALGVPLTREVAFSLVWLVSAVLVGAAVVFRDGYDHLNPFASRGYTTIPNADLDERPSKVKSYTDTHQTEKESDPDSFNMFDPANLPPRLAEYANLVYAACEDLGNFFGFQDSSVRNQAEHLLILLSNNRRYMSTHILPPSVQPPSPTHALHAKVFSNYVKWCRAMGVQPNFSKMNTSMNAPPAVASRVVDLVLYFCVWGESCNLRHMPECVWFLYHKTMEEYSHSEGYTQTRSLYAGHFLDFVVTPIYNIVAKVRRRLSIFRSLSHY